uniref:Eukaryotic translation initiation factor 2A n=1 Tax=Rhizophora mucronata TaxID=61149 RepID=A0A2P2LM92_RHIMU
MLYHNCRLVNSSCKLAPWWCLSAYGVIQELELNLKLASFYQMLVSILEKFATSSFFHFCSFKHPQGVAKHNTAAMML